MYFHTWLKKNHKGGYINPKKVLNYLKNKLDSEVTMQIFQECLNARLRKIEFIPIDVWKDEWYNFKGKKFKGWMKNNGKIERI